MKLGCKVVIIIFVFIVSFVLLIHKNSNMTLKWENNKIEQKKENKEPVVSVTRQDGTLEKIPLETYLVGVVGSEMPASFEEEALKAQCVAARTFVTKRNYNVDDTTQTQVYHDNEQLKQIWGSNYETYHKKLVAISAATKQEILTYQGDVISAVFFSSSCGKTGNSEEYWDGKTPYLRSVDSPWEKTMKGYEVTTNFTQEEFHKKLGFQNNITQISEPSYYKSGYVESIVIDTITFSGRDIREKLGLRSSCFTITKKNEEYSVVTKGYGHGLGMSQDGAQGMAKQGATYTEILKHYYTGVNIEKKD
ncbi:MAG: stage II sporulation protein D [Longicatena sp.]